MSGTVFNPNKIIIYGTMTQDDKEPLQAQMEFDTNNVVIEQECFDSGPYSIKIEFNSFKKRLIIPEKAEVIPSEKWEISW